VAWIFVHYICEVERAQRTSTSSQTWRKKISKNSKDQDQYAEEIRRCFNPFAILYHGFIFGVKTSLKSLVILKNFGDISLFLLSKIFLADASNVTFSTAAVIATSVLNIDQLYVALSAGTGFIGAAVGLVFWSALVKRKWLQPKTVLGINLFAFACLLVWMEFLQFFWELFVITFIAGFNVGSFGAFTKSILFTMIPALYDARFFSFSEFSEKVTSWISPLVIASITTVLGEQYYKEVTLLTVGFEIVVGGILLFFVNVEYATQYAKEFDPNDVDTTCCGCWSGDGDVKGGKDGEVP